MAARGTDRKIILSGNIMEVFHYEKTLFYGFTRPERIDAPMIEKTEDMKKEILQRSLSQTKRKLIRVINSNARQWVNSKGRSYDPKFVTLTFKENVTELTEANREYTNFLKNFNYHLTKSRNNYLKYICVPEFQKRGAVHFHSIFFNLPWFKNDALAKIWANGFINIREVSHIPNVGMYMTKYMTKDALDERLQSRKRFFSSRNLYRPIMIRDKFKVQKIVRIIRRMPIQYKTIYESDYQGKTDLRVYDFSKFLELKSAVLKSIR